MPVAQHLLNLLALALGRKKVPDPAGLKSTQPVDFNVKFNGFLT